MNSNEFNQTLFNVTAETIESLAMMFLVPEDEAPFVDSTDTRLVSVEFSGPFAGTLFLAVSESILPELAGNMLGTEQTSKAQQLDATKELLNVVCGNLLPVIAGTTVVFHVEAPQIQPDGARPEQHAGMVRVAETCLYLETGKLELILFADAEALETIAPAA